MTTVNILQEQIAKLGYWAIENNYIFSDVFSDSAVNRKVSLAAFTHTPPSYRNAALAVVDAKGRNAEEIAIEYRALGAPLLFLIEANDVTVWQIKSAGAPRLITRAPLGELEALFSQHADDWHPQSIHRAKSIGQFSRSYQLDFVDLGLLPAIEGELHAKLDRLLNETLVEAIGLRPRGTRYQINQRLLFRTIFRLLAAKVLQDRGHELAATWNPADINSVLREISKYYTLEPLPGEQTSLQNAIFASSWDRLRSAINFRNISADDLAFVYENTLITPDTREHFGTHSTPRPVAEYVVSRLEFWRHNPQDLRVYEPFAGAGIFMVAALRHLRELLPIHWTDQQRHEFLMQRIAGDEIEPFAKEVATLSLILADYPNANGWAVSQVDLFKEYQIAKRARASNVILCNPPFEDFTADERNKYPEAASRSISKPIAALEAALDARPKAIGFVLPEPFLKGSQYQVQRQRIERLYKDIELVALPDRTFKHSVVRSSLVIACEPRENQTTGTFLKSSVITVGDRDRFLRSGEVTKTRSVSRRFSKGAGELWINELEEVWESLTSNPTLESVASVHRGLHWHGGQPSAVRDTQHKGFALGIHAANAVKAFALQEPEYLDYRSDNIRRAGDLPWAEAKILANAARLSRGPWCFAAAIDNEGLIFSQQLFGIWPKPAARLHALCALLNSPLANAYIASHSPADRIRVHTVLSVPIPVGIPKEIDELAKQYMRIVAHGESLFSTRITERADKILDQIDAHVLQAYDLPPRLERQLLEYFRGEQRPTLHEWSHWFPESFTPFIPLHEYLSEDHRKARKELLLKVFTPLPDDEAIALRDTLD
jgi:hypothetical protein